MEYIEPNSERWLSLEDLPSEKWVKVKGYEELYKCSNYGRIKTIDRYVDTKIRHSLKRLIKSKICKYEFKKGSTPYCRIQLYKDGHYKHYNVHTIIATSFGLSKYKFKYDNRENKWFVNLNSLEINHKDENVRNNALSNLEWCTHLYNVNYGTRTERATLKAQETKRRKKENYAKAMEI